MKTVDYESLLQKHKPRGYVSIDTNKIANRLICELSIQSGYGLARFLEVDVSLDNHMAVRVWVQRRLDAQGSYLFDEMVYKLQSELYELLSMLSYGL